VGDASINRRYILSINRRYVSSINRRYVSYDVDATGHVRFWHYTSGKCMHTINELRKGSQTLSSAFNPLGDRILTVGADPQIYMYDVATKKRINSLEATYVIHTFTSHNITISCDLTLLSLHLIMYID